MRYDPDVPPSLSDAAAAGRLAAMRRMLVALPPDGAADALRTLREAFPDAPLAERVRALDRFRKSP